jgi:DNA polymerase (family 10)
MDNREITAHLVLISQLMALDGANKFKVMVFQNAADAIKGTNIDVTQVDPKTIDGVGDSIAAVIRQLIKTGTSDKLDELSKRWKPSVMEMTRVNGIGPKTAYKLHLEHGIQDFAELVKFAESGGLNERLTKAVFYARDTASGRIPHIIAKYLADHVIAEIQDLTRNVQVCGSIRRNTDTSKDVDIVACVENGNRAKLFEKFNSLGEVIGSGDRKSSIRFTHLNTTMQVDLWVVDPWYWGSALVYATGSKDHCVAIRSLAKSRGLIVNEYGIFRQDVEYNEQNQLGGRDEHDIYRVLNLEYQEPAERNGELKV